MTPPNIADMEAEAACTITLPFPSAVLAGHASGDWRKASHETKRHREWARLATLEARAKVPTEGDVPLHVRFYPPDRRGDRTNYWNRCKAYFDGIADALKINDARFLPSMSFAEPEKPGRVEVTL